MVHAAGAVSHWSEISCGSEDAPDWIVQHGEQTDGQRYKRGVTLKYKEPGRKKARDEPILICLFVFK